MGIELILSRLRRCDHHIESLCDLLRNNDAFFITLRTDIIDGTRSLYTKPNKSIYNKASLIVGDVLHSLRSTLENLYWIIVSPHVEKKHHKSIQFPFAHRNDQLVEVLKLRQAKAAGDDFYQSMLDFNPSYENSRMLYLVILINLSNSDKHRLLIPSSYALNISSCDLIQHIPDFPPNFSNVMLSNNEFDIVWRNYDLKNIDIGVSASNRYDLFFKKVNIKVPCDIECHEIAFKGDLIETLTEMRDYVNDTIYHFKQFIPK